MSIITSNQNQHIKLVHSLQQRKNRELYGLFVAEGLRIVETLIQSGAILNHLFLTQGQYAVMHTDSVNAQIVSQNILVVSDSVMQYMSSATQPSGVLAVFEIPKQKTIEEMHNGLVLCNVTDPGNCGTLIRTAAAMNVKNIVVVEGVDPWNQKVVQATAGTIGFVSILSMQWAELVLHVKKNNLQLCALVVSGGIAPEMIDMNNSFLVVGNESQGLSGQQKSDCTQCITIAMPGNTESLNASVAGSIALYAATKNK